MGVSRRWSAIKYKVKLMLNPNELRLNEVSHRGKLSVRTVKRALALLKADEGLRDDAIAGGRFGQRRYRVPAVRKRVSSRKDLKAVHQWDRPQANR